MSLALTLLAAFSAQDPALSSHSEAAFDLGALPSFTSHLFIDEPGDGRIWARGRTYKASFGADGFSYIPFLGSDAPKNYPVTFVLDAVMLGGEALESTQPDYASNRAETVTLDHGQFQEVYHLETDQVEQTFVFESLPATGELLVRMNVATELDQRTDGAGFAFANERGEVRYGAAIAVDADGVTLDLAQRWTGDGIEIIVPEAFVASAAFPLVVDPVVSTFGLTSDNRDQIDVDTAFDSQNNTYQVVFSEAHSATDNDVITYFYNASLGIVTLPASIDISSEHWSVPKTASAYFDTSFLCAANVGTDPATSRVRGRVRHAATGHQIPQFDIGPVGSGRCDVGGLGAGASSNFDFLVVYERLDLATQDVDIAARSVGADGTLSGGPFVIAGDPDNSETRPAISKSSGRSTAAATDHRYLIAWQREVASGNNDIWARVVRNSGSFFGHSAFAVATPGNNLNPDVSVRAHDARSGSADPYWTVAHQRLNGSDLDVFVTVVTDGDAGPASNIAEMQDDTDRQQSQRDPMLAFDGGDYLLVYLSDDGAGGRDAYFTAFNVISQGTSLRIALTERRSALRAEDGTASRVALASHFDGGGPVSGGLSGNGLAVWIAEDPTGTDDEVGGSIVAETQTYAVGRQVCTTNPNSTGRSAWISIMEGTVLDPTDALDVRVTNLPPGTFGFLLTSQQLGFTANAGGSDGNLCLAGPIGRFTSNVQLSNAQGTSGVGVVLASIPQPFGSIAAVSGDRWHFQYWTRDTVGGVATSNFSNAATVFVY